MARTNIFASDQWKNYDYQEANERLRKEATKLENMTLDELLKIYDADIALEIANAYHLPQGHELGVEEK